MVKQIDYKKVLKYRAENPEASYKDIADSFKCDRSTIYRILTKGTKETKTIDTQEETSENAPVVSTAPLIQETPAAFERKCDSCGGRLMKSHYEDENTGEKKECWYCMDCGDIFEE